MSAQIHRTLTPDELAEYHERGYVVVPDVFSPTELDEINQELDCVLDEQRRGKLPNNHTPARGWIMSLGLASEKTAKICADARLLNLVQDVVKPGIAIYSAKLVTKEPFDSTTCHWHQDDAYYAQNSQSHTRMSVWVALQDVTVETGCLQVVPRSHKRGLQPYSRREGGTCNLGLDVEIDPSQKVHCPVAAGAVILFSALLWHGSDGNRSSQRRRALIVSYQEAAVMGGNANQWRILRSA